jgi:hypothetical protein
VLFQGAEAGEGLTQVSDLRGGNGGFTFRKVVEPKEACHIDIFVWVLYRFC